jgi:hypothetical protein
MKHSGLERIRWIDAIDDFVRQYGRGTPRWAIFCTYEIDLKEFGRLLPVLARRGRRFRSVLLSDAGTLEESLKDFDGRLPGAVNIHPVRVKRGGVFHPKIVFLRAGRHARVCFGSANLTTGGLGRNLELWTFSEAPEIIQALTQFLLDLTTSSNLIVDDGALRSMRRAVSTLVPRSSRAVWSSLEEPFAFRIRNSPDRGARRATIISPMYAGERGIKAARAAIPTPKVRIYTSGVPAVIPNSSVFVYQPYHIADQPEEEAEAWPRELHAKAYVFRHGHSAGAWVGSANFTAQALSKSVAQGGNVELLVRAELPKDEADALDVNLRELFKRPKDSHEKIRLKLVRPRPVSTILACELVGSETAPVLVVHSTQRQGHVILEYKGHTAHVAIKNGRGKISGQELKRLLPYLDLSAAQPIKIHQLLGGKLIPIVVNVPHVPPDIGPGAIPQASLDALLDDLIGRIRVPRWTDDGEAENNKTDTGKRREDNSSEDAEADYFEKRLDEVKHQGEIDQLAVKAALLKKLITRATTAGFDRKIMLADALETLRKACPPHLVPAIKSLFKQANTL